MSDAARIVKKHGGTLSNGNWCRVSDVVEEASARAIAAELRERYYQVRSVEKAKDGKWEVIFR